MEKLYKVVELKINKPLFKEIIIAELHNLQYEGFEELIDSVKAYVPASDFDEHALDDVLQRYGEQADMQLLKVATIVPKNWNEEWEQHYFTPIQLGDLVVVKAPFHELTKDYPYTITIAPKMAFGTGHHETTYLVMQQILALQWEGKRVLDFGCGTGILAILAAQLGATHITAIDNDPNAYENTLENLATNQITDVTAVLADHPNIENQTFDVILANINRNTILAQFENLYHVLNEGGFLIVSGILVSDMSMIAQKAKDFSLAFNHYAGKNEWVAMQFSKNVVS